MASKVASVHRNENRKSLFVLVCGKDGKDGHVGTHIAILQMVVIS